MIHAIKKWSHYLMPREFVLYTNNHALQFITRKEKLNQKNAKWVQFMRSFNFILRNISGNGNKVVNSLRRSCFVLYEFQVSTLGYQNLNEIYQEVQNFKEAYEAFKNPMRRDQTPSIKY